jgi:hypothetical protein
MQLSTAYKQRLAKAARMATAGAMVVSSVGTVLAPSAFATPLNENRTLISDSRISGASPKYTIEFKTPSSSTTTIARVNIEFCTTSYTFGPTCTAPAGMNITASQSTGVTATNFGGGTSVGSFAGDSANTMHVTFTGGGTETNVLHSLEYTGLITNPTSVGTYYTRVRTFSDSSGTLPLDDGTSAFATVSRVTVSGRVLENMAFTVATVNNASTCSATSGDTATATSQVTAVPFGNFLSGTPRVVCQKVKTVTNAVNGYSTTIIEVNAGAGNIGAMCRQTASNCDTNGATTGISAADAIVDAGAGVLDATPRAWVPATTVGLGINANGAEADSAFVNGTNYRSVSGTTPIVLAGTSVPTNGTDTYVVFKADVPGVQTAGVYQNAVEYVTTPKF